MPFSDADAQPRFTYDIDTYIDSTSSTPFVSAPSSPVHAHAPSAYFFSAPPSPMHLLQNSKPAASSSPYQPLFLPSDSASFEFEFEFSSRFSPLRIHGNASMTSADELFFNGQIRPMKFAQEEGPEFSETTSAGGRDPKANHSHRKARSMSPLGANARYDWQGIKTVAADEENETKESCSASSSWSSSSSASGRNSKKWIFLKDLLNRSKSEGRANGKERFWSASPAKDKTGEKKNKSENRKSAIGKPANGVWRRRVPPSAHELHYTANRAQSEEMKKKTFLPYRQGLLGCLGFSSKSYGAFSGFTRNLNPMYSG